MHSSESTEKRELLVQHQKAVLDAMATGEALKVAAGKGVEAFLFAERENRNACARRDAIAARLEKIDQHSK